MKKRKNIFWTQWLELFAFFAASSQVLHELNSQWGGNRDGEVAELSNRGSIL